MYAPGLLTSYPSTIPKYRIAGVWKDDDGVITHYAVHTVSTGSVSKGVKTSKAAAIGLLEAVGSIAEVRIWNYTTAKWRAGKRVEVVNGRSGKYLRSDPDDSLTDNLGHLINYSALS